MSTWIEVQTLLAWPLAILVAWGVGELASRWGRVPRIATYAVVGVLFAPSVTGVLPAVSPDGLDIAATIAFGLILFEAGYRTNLSWLIANPWLLATSLLEAGLTFGAVRWILGVIGLPAEDALLLAALAIATSPAATLRVINEQRAAGQVTERAIHLSVLDCVLGIIAFMAVRAQQLSDPIGSGVTTTDSVLGGLALALALGGLFGILFPPLLRAVTRDRDEGTMAFALAVAVVVGLAEALVASPALAALTFGLVARARRTVLSARQRGFGTLGELLSVMLFVYLAAALDWSLVPATLGTGVVVVLVRLATTMLATTAFALPSGITWQKGIWTGVTLSPMSALALVLLEPAGVALLPALAPLLGGILLLEILGPILVVGALRAARELPEPEVRG
ncbi:MAG: cation:proton antiporter [Gemmatimonadaceae bacterium]